MTTKAVRLAALAMVAGIVGAYLIGEHLPQINVAWLLVAFIAGWIAGIYTITRIVKPLLDDLEREAKGEL